MEGNQRNESNQIKSNQQKHKKWYTTWIWLLWILYEVNSTIFINNTLFWFRLNILLNESSSLTFWIRFGISNYNPYSIFWSTYQCHKNKDHRNSILQNWLDVRFGRSTFNHFKSFHYYFALSTNMNHHPIFLPYSAVSDITIHTLLSIAFFYYQLIIHKRMDHWLSNRNCLILCFHWLHFFSWQGIWLSILRVWNQWINGRGERELE